MFGPLYPDGLPLGKFTFEVPESMTDVWQLRQQLAAVTAERDALAAQLALSERYGADQWRRGNAGQEPQEFEEWKREQDNRPGAVPGAGNATMPDADAWVKRQMGE